MGILQRIRNVVATWRRLDRRLDNIQFLQGLLTASTHENRESTVLRDHEFRVFSQWGEDGILQYLTRAIEVRNKTFVEFGVEDFVESNCRFLLMKDDWAGFLIDGSEEAVRKIRGSYFYWKHDLNAVAAFITRENINDILSLSGFDEDVGILSIDLDGNDYFVLDAIKVLRPRILVCEYNSVFGADRQICVPYDPEFERASAHFSLLYWGASLGAMATVAARKGYSLVGCNSAGNNAFFVRDDLMNERVRALTVQHAFVLSRYRESRNEDGDLTYVTGAARMNLIKGMPVYDVESAAIVPL